MAYVSPDYYDLLLYLKNTPTEHFVSNLPPPILAEVPQAIASSGDLEQIKKFVIGSLLSSLVPFGATYAYRKIRNRLSARTK